MSLYQWKNISQNEIVKKDNISATDIDAFKSVVQSYCPTNYTSHTIDYQCPKESCYKDGGCGTHNGGYDQECDCNGFVHCDLATCTKDKDD